MKQLTVLFLLLATSWLKAQIPEITLSQGQIINRSVRIKTGTYTLNGAPTDIFQIAGSMNSATPVLVIRGQGIVVDFQQALLQGSNDQTTPDQFYGLAIRVYGQNITLKNARIRGFKVALLADSVQSLTLDNCDFSYNYRPRLRSIREHEDFSDWLSYHNNENDEWLRYGAAIYLRRCDGATVRNCRASANQNALLMTRCNDGVFYNNSFNFNSGLGIGMYRSSRNRVMHNRLDWNVRGYSHGFYQRGQDSAALLVYEQSSNNVFAFNSCTHSGDGFFLWAGQSTMDNGEGGCNDNLLFGNDFSHAPTNGVEVTFSRNDIRGNYITECTYGIWGGYSFGTNISGNLIADCRTGIAIEHGQNNTIRQNLFQNDTTGIQLWARAEQPADWGYAQKRDTRSRDTEIDRNVFQETRRPLKVSASQNISVNGENLFFNFDKLLQSDKPNQNLKFLRNDLYAPANAIDLAWQHPELAPQKGLNFSHPGKTPEQLYEPLEIPYNQLEEPDSLPGGHNTGLPPGTLRGRRYIIVNEWGPYDFKRPLAVLDDIKKRTERGQAVYEFSLLGPAGNWRLLNADQGLVASAVTGSIPAKISVTVPIEKADDLRLEFEYTGAQSLTTEFGEVIPAGNTYRFHFDRYVKHFDWKVQFFNLDTLVNGQPAAPPTGKPAAEKQVETLYFAWWGSPAEGVQADRFATVAETAFSIEAGEYLIELTSDDGARLFIDGKNVIDNWDIHEPETDEIRVRLGGKHRLRIEHYEASGFSTLDFRIRPLR